MNIRKAALTLRNAVRVVLFSVVMMLKQT